MTTINIKDVFTKAFGVAPKYLVPHLGAMDFTLDRDYSGIKILENDTPWTVSSLGTPIMESLTLQGDEAFKTFEIQNGKPITVIKSIAPYDFELSPMIDISQDKVIVTTPITGRNGTVKEYIYTDDYHINIRGLLVGDGNQYPYEKKKALNYAFQQNTSRGVWNTTLNDLGVYAVALKSIQFGDLEGYNNICTYTITALSDSDIILTIQNQQKT